MDRSHAFDSYFETIRYNVLFASIVSALPNASGYCTDKAQKFATAFLHAFMEATIQKDTITDRNSFLDLWLKSSYILIQWRSSYLKRIVILVRALSAKVPVLPFPAERLWETIAQQPAAEVMKHGSAWALQWSKCQMEEVKHKREERKRKATDDLLVTAMGDIRVTDVPKYLSGELFERPHVQPCRARLTRASSQHRARPTMRRTSGRHLMLRWICCRVVTHRSTSWTSCSRVCRSCSDLVLVQVQAGHTSAQAVRLNTNGSCMWWPPPSICL
jgi:hypothetical protein